MGAHADGRRRFHLQDVIRAFMVENPQMTEQSGFIHQLRQAWARQFTQIHFAQRMAGKFHQLGPQTKVLLMIDADKPLTLQFTQQQVSRAFGNAQRFNDRGGAARANPCNQIQNINGASERRDFLDSTYWTPV